MQIKKNAYVVYIDFDGDIVSRYCNGKYLVFTELDEVKEVIKEALNDLMQHEIKRNIKAGAYVGEKWCNISEILNDNTLLEEFIEYGGLMGGNWEISIVKSR